MPENLDTALTGPERDQVARIKERFAQAQADRSTWEAHAQEIVRYMMPFRPDIVTPEWETEGRKKMHGIYLSHATHAGLLFASGMAALMANKSLNWFRVGCAIKDLEKVREVKLWLEQVEEIFYNLFDSSNFYTADHEAYVDDGFLGTSCIFVGPHPRMRVYYDFLNIGECYPAVNRYGQIDKNYRQFKLSARNVVEQFGAEKVSERVRGYLRGNKPETPVMILQATEPRMGGQRGEVRDQKPWADYYLEMETNQLLQEGGFDEFPFVFTRYFAPAHHAMGRGPGMTALSTVKELQKKRQDILRAGEKRLDPPLLLPDEGFVGPVIKLMPAGRGGINYINADGPLKDRIAAFPVGGDLGYTDKDIEASKAEIGQIFFNDLMLMQMEKEMTATEFIGLLKEKMQMLGPFVGRLMSERYNPIFNRTFNILWEAGEIPPPPNELMALGGRLKVEYISTLALAQKQSQSQGIQQTVGFAEQLVQVAGPAPLDRLDLEGALVQVAENSGYPQRLIRSDEQVAQIREQRAQAQAQAQQAAALQEGVKSIPHLSKSPQPGSPMEQLMSALNEGAGMGGRA